MSPRTKFFVLTMVIGAVFSLLLYMMDIQFGSGYYPRGFVLPVLIVALILYSLLTRVAEKLRQK